MANPGVIQSTEEVRTEGKSWGPVSSNITYAGLIATVLVFILGAFGIAVPADVALAAATLFMAAVAWFSKGRKVVVESRVVDPAPSPTIQIIPDGDGSHRAEAINETL